VQAVDLGVEVQATAIECRTVDPKPIDHEDHEGGAVKPKAAMLICTSLPAQIVIFGTVVF